jgi:hypothetical protein
MCRISQSGHMESVVSCQKPDQMLHNSVTFYLCSHLHGKSLLVSFQLIAPCRKRQLLIAKKRQFGRKTICLSHGHQPGKNSQREAACESMRRSGTPSRACAGIVAGVGQSVGPFCAADELLPPRAEQVSWVSTDQGSPGRNAWDRDGGTVRMLRALIARSSAHTRAAHTRP